MSGEEGPINLPMSALFALVFAIIGIFLLMGIIFSGLKPYEQIARANADRLASAIDEACFNGEGHEVEISDFYLPQNTPIFSKESAFAPTLRIRSDGDPKYVLYYEMFPPGEAIGWEVYHDFDYRAVAMLPDNLPADFDMHSFINDVKNFVFDEYKDDANPPKTVDVFIGNLLLSDSIDPITGEAADAKSITMGKWDGNKFVLNTEFFSSALNKTIPKYLACGDGALCLKTPSAIYRYGLPHCKGKINYINLRYTPFGLDCARRETNFYFASPCTAGHIDINLKDCEANFVNFSIYDYQEELSNNGNYHVERLNDLNVLIQPSSSVKIPGNKAKCVEVAIGGGSEKNFCYTINREIAQCIDPVTTFANYIYYGDKKASIFVLKPASAKIIENPLVWIGEKLDLTVIWRWPI